MAFYKKQKLNGKWYARAITIGEPYDTDDVAEYLSGISTVSRGDVYAVLTDLGMAMSWMMSQGRSVHLKGVGTFFYSCSTAKNGVDTPEEVSPSLINKVHVRFIPEYSRTQSGKVVKQTLLAKNLDWQDIDEIK